MFPLRAIIAACVALRIHPNILTFVGVIITGWSAVHLATDRFVTGGAIMVVASIFDFIDGKVAHETGLMSKFGGFWGSVIDRFSDILLFIGLIYLYSSLGRTDYVMVASFAMMFALMTSYTRARAESLIAKCKVGFMERPERMVLFMIGAFTNRMAAVLWVILVLSIFSVADRVILTYRVLEQKPERPSIVDRSPLPRPHAVERVLLDLRPRDVAVRRNGDFHPRVRVAHPARLDRGSGRLRERPNWMALGPLTPVNSQLHDFPTPNR